MIGTAPGEWVTERERLRYGFEVDGYYIELGDPVAYESDDLGWLADRPTFRFPNGSTIRCRMTTVLHRENGRWKVMHMHASVGVPDEEVAGLQQKWGGEA